MNQEKYDKLKRDGICVSCRTNKALKYHVSCQRCIDRQKRCMIKRCKSTGKPKKCYKKQQVKINGSEYY